MNNLTEENFMFVPIRILFYAATVSGALIIWWFIPPLLIILTAAIKLMIFLLRILIIAIIIIMLINIMSIKFIKLVKLTMFFGLIINLPFLSTYLFAPMLKLGSMFLKKLDQA
jgi:hypothetical protein